MDTNAMNSFIDKLLDDADLRKEFADNPKGVLEKEGISLPEGMIADKLDGNVLEERLSALRMAVHGFDKRMGARMDRFSTLAGMGVGRVGGKLDPGKVARTVIGTVV